MNSEVCGDNGKEEGRGDIPLNCQKSPLEANSFALTVMIPGAFFWFNEAHFIQGMESSRLS